MSSYSFERLKREFSNIIDEGIIKDVVRSADTEDAAREYLRAMALEAEKAQRCPPPQSDPQTLQDVCFDWLSSSDSTVSEMTAENTDIHSQECDPTYRSSEDGGTQNTIYPEGDAKSSEDGGTRNTIYPEGDAKSSEDGGTGNTIYPDGDAKSFWKEGTNLDTSSYDIFAIPGIDPDAIFSQDDDLCLEILQGPQGSTNGAESSLRESRDHSGTNEKTSWTGLSSLEPSLEMRLSAETGIASCSAPVDGSVDEMTAALLVKGATMTETIPTGTSTVGVCCSRTSDFLDQSTPSYLEPERPCSEKTGTEASSALVGGSAAEDCRSKSSEELSRRNSVTSSISSLGSQSSTAYPASEPGACNKPAVSSSTLNTDAAVFVPRERQSFSSTDGSCPDLYGINTASNSTLSPNESGRSTSLSPPNTPRHQGWHMDTSSWEPQGKDTSVRGWHSGAILPAAKPKFKPVKKIDFNEMYGRDAEEISNLVQNGAKVMVLMRGVPGSGKTTMARCIKGKGKIYSADNFFTDEYGRYHFDGRRLQDAHGWNQRQVLQGLQCGVNPVIVDNTNIEIWEMEPYVRLACDFGYKVLIREPKGISETAEVLSRRCIHRVPVEKIQAKLALYQQMTDEQLLRQVCGDRYQENAVTDDWKSGVTTGRTAGGVQGNDLTWEEVDSTSAEPKPRRLRTISQDRQAGEGDVRRKRDGSKDESLKEQESLEKQIDMMRESFKNTPPTFKSPQKSPATPTRVPKKLPPKRDWANLYPKPAPAPLPLRPQPPISAGSSGKSGCQVDAGTMVEAEDYTVDRKDENLGYRMMTGRARGSIAKDLVALEETKIGVHNNHRDKSTMTTDVSEMEYLYEMFHVLNPDCSRDEIERYVRSLEDPADLVSIVENLYPDDRAPASQRAKSVSLLDQSMQIVMQKGAVNENAVIKNLQDGREKRQESIVQFHRQHSNTQVEEADAFVAAPKMKAGGSSSYPPTGVHSATEQRKPKPLPRPARDTRMASDGAFISFPASVLKQLKKAFGQDSTRHGHESTADGKEVYIWIDKKTGQELLKGMVNGMEQSLYAEGPSVEERKLREAQLREDELLARKLQEEDEADEKEKLRNNKRSAVSHQVPGGGNWNQLQKEVPCMNSIIEEEKKAMKAEERQNEERQKKRMENQGIAFFNLHNRLCKAFPTIPEDLLKAYLADNDYSYKKTENVIRNAYGFAPVKLETTSGTGRFEDVASLRKEFEDSQMTDRWVLTDADYKMLTSRIGELQQKRDEYAAAAIRCHQAKKPSVCFFYSSEAGRLQREIQKEKKKVFSYKMELCEKKMGDTNKLDLHGFSTEEAVKIVQDVVRSREQAFHSFGKKAAHDSIEIVTGRGKHSQNGAQIKPAIINFLETKGYAYTELNPGAVLVFFENRTLS